MQQLRSESQLIAKRQDLGAILNALGDKWKRNRTVSPSAEDLERMERTEDAILAINAELREIEEKKGLTEKARAAKTFERWLRYRGMPEASDSVACSSRFSYQKGDSTPVQIDYRVALGTEGHDGGAYPGSGSGAFVPVGFTKRVVSAAKATAPWFEISNLTVTPTGGVLPMPADNDIGVSAVPISENAADSNSDINLVTTYLGAYRYTSQVVKVSNETLQDTGIDIEEYLAGRFAARMMRGLDPKFTNGVGGTTEPLGALTGLTPSFTIQGSGDTDGSGTANTIGLRDVVALEKALDPAYRLNARWLMHPNTLAALRQVKDKQGRPVFESLNRPEGSVLLGYPVTLAPSMDQLQSTASSPTVTRIPLAFGDFGYYKIRLVAPQMIRLSQLYAVSYQTGFLLNFRTDAALVDGASANRAIVTAQSVY